MTEEEIAARKFAIASQKDEQERRSREEAEREAKKNGTELQQPNRDEKTFAGRPDDAVIAGTEPVAGTDSLANEGRISIGSKAAADSLLAIDKKQAEDTMWLKNEYVPVTSFIHTLQFDNYKRIYQAYQTPADFYANTYMSGLRFQGDSIYDKTRHYEVRNTVAISMLEGFNKWAKAA